MYRAYKFRIYPTDDVRILINKTFGCYRHTYNYFLGKCKKDGVKSAYDMCKRLPELITQGLSAKKQEHHIELIV